MERITIPGYRYHDDEFMDSGVAKFFNRLAAYEDTGLEPQDIISAVDMGKIACALHELNAYKDIGSIEHLRELIQAEQAGLLVVLPCKVGDTVYVIGESCDFCETYLDEPERCMRCEKGHYVEERGFELWMLSELNESIFLNREEAEAALKGGDGCCTSTLFQPNRHVGDSTVSV